MTASWALSASDTNARPAATISGSLPMKPEPDNVRAWPPAPLRSVVSARGSDERAAADRRRRGGDRLAGPGEDLVVRGRQGSHRTGDRADRRGCGEPYLLRRAISPLQALAALARRVDLANPGERMPGAESTSEAGELALTFNEMLDRLEAERREATGRVLAGAGGRAAPDRPGAARPGRPAADGGAAGPLTGLGASSRGVARRGG